MPTKLFPMVQFKEGIWEIDEFDVASMFLIIGSEKAMVIDFGTSIGDLYGAVRMLTDKPLIPVVTHAHGDHYGAVWQFGEAWINPKDRPLVKPLTPAQTRRSGGAKLISMRQKGSAAWRMYEPHNLYGYDPQVDIYDVDPEKQAAVVYHDMTDGMQFDLGGGRIITAYDCPGHSPGEMVLLDEQSRCLFSGDALNYNLGLGSVSIETACRYLERLRDMGDRYDGIYNGHHDFRAMGVPLGDDCLPNAIDLCHQLLDGSYSPVSVPNFWGPGREPAVRTMVRKGKNYIGYNEARIFDSQMA